MFWLRDKLITEGEKRETSTKTCNETMLRNKLKVFVSRISPPYYDYYGLPQTVLKMLLTLDFRFSHLSGLQMLGLVTGGIKPEKAPSHL